MDTGGRAGDRQLKDAPPESRRHRIYQSHPVSGCGDNTSVQTVDWYKAHAPERNAMIAKCEASPSELAASANCINAKTAANHLAVDKRGYVDLTPINPLKGGQ